MKFTSACSLFFRLVGLFLCLVLLSLPGVGGLAARHTAIIPVTTTIQAAIDIAQDGDTVSIPSGTYNESLTIDKNLTLAGQVNLSARIFAIENHRVITVEPGHDLILKDLVLGLGIAESPGENEGGAVRIQDGILTIDHCEIFGNRADYGGAVYQGGAGRVIVQNSSYIRHNSANIHGGGIYVNNGLSLSNSSIYANDATIHGGGATVWGGDLSIVGGVVSSNWAGQNGGAFNVNNSVSVDQVVFNNNVAGTNGGAILQWNGNTPYSVNIQRSTFSNNEAGTTGGALSVAQGATTTISQSMFENNEVDTKNATDPKGGAVYFSDTAWAHTLTITSSTFLSNSLACVLCSSPSGGGIYAKTTSPGKVILDGDVFAENQGWLGGGLHADTALIQHTVFQGNSGGDGAGAYLSGSAQIKQSQFLQNDAWNGGGGLFVGLSDFSLSIEDTKFIGNKGGIDLGGAMSVHAKTIIMTNVVVADTQVVSGSAILFANINSAMTLRHLTVNDTHLHNGMRTGTIGIRVQGPTAMNIYNSMITNHHTGVKVDAGSAGYLIHTLWFGNVQNIQGDSFSYYDINPIISDPAYAADRYHVTAASGAINHGVDSFIYHDIDGDARDSIPDIGVDEFRSHIYLPHIDR